jgi:hypothetical protein
VAGTDEIKYWLMSWGGKAEVLSPATLRDEMISEAQNMLRCYQEQSRGFTRTLNNHEGHEGYKEKK